MMIQSRSIFAMVLSAIAFTTSVAAFSAEYAVDKDHTTIDFQVNHLLGKQRGQFDDFDGSFSFDPAHTNKSKVSFTIQAASIDTGNKKRDEHLRSPDFFNVEKFKTLSFRTTSFEAAGDKKFTLTGDLTIHGVTKKVVFNVDYLGNIKDPWGNNRAAFTAVTQINRKDFGLTWNKLLEAGGVMVGEDVEISINVEAIEKKAAAPAKS
jgi:polyisoprenoid-binding protein YceI